MIIQNTLFGRTGQVLMFDHEKIYSIIQFMRMNSWRFRDI